MQQVCADRDIGARRARDPEHHHDGGHEAGQHQHSVKPRQQRADGVQQHQAERQAGCHREHGVGLFEDLPGGHGERALGLELIDPLLGIGPELTHPRGEGAGLGDQLIGNPQLVPGTPQRDQERQRAGAGDQVAQREARLPAARFHGHPIDAGAGEH